MVRYMATLSLPRPKLVTLAGTWLSSLLQKKLCLSYVGLVGAHIGDSSDEQMR